MPSLPPHHLKLVLVHPRIAPNTGNIGRLCAATGAELHLVRPLGFVLSDRNLRRSAMDYWSRVKLTIHDDLHSFLAFAANQPLWLFTTRATRSAWDVHFGPDAWLVLGSETHGLPTSLLERFADRCVRIPQASDERCLNLSTAAGVAMYEALRQLRT